jgi:SAM-dependent methyltransferase
VTTTGPVDANRLAWDHWAALGSVASVPVGRLTAAAARHLVDPDGWLPWREIRRVLVLAGAGGQQAPAFAMLGCEVTVVDVSPGQLELDQRVADELGLDLRCMQADMSRVADLGLDPVDLVYQPISTCYTPDVRSLYQQVRATLRQRGLYRVEHWNPVHMRLWAGGTFDGAAYRLAAGPPGEPIVSTVASGPSGESLLESWTYPHSLADLLGGLGDAGFVVRRLAEDCGGDAAAAPGSEAHLASVVPPFFRLLARLVA